MREDIQKAREKYEYSSFLSKAIAALSKSSYEDAESLLNNDETVLFAEITNMIVMYSNTRIPEKFNGVIFLTDKRIIFKSQSLRKYASEIMPLDEVISVHFKYDKFTQFTHGYIEINSSTKIYSIELSSNFATLKQIYQEFETAVNNYKSQQASQSSTIQPNAPQPDIADQIEKLAQLRDKGILTEEEFQAKKTDLLSRM